LEDPGEVLTALHLAAGAEGDEASRAFALLSIGELGGLEARRELIDRLTRGRQNLRPWAALAAGRLARGTADPEVGRVLARLLVEERNRDTRAALALAIGLSRTTEGRPSVRRLVREGVNGRERGFAALAAALGEDEGGRPVLRQALGETVDPRVRALAGLALAVFREPQDAEPLAALFAAVDEPSVLATAALALAWNGTDGAVEALRRECAGSGPAERRAAALLALGLAVSPEPVPASAAATAGWDYLASVEAAHAAARLWM
jgi:HEAT repeat protein